MALHSPDGFARRPVCQNSLIGPDQFILILRDITARKEAELQRESSRNMLALGEMAAVLAHEIRNPLGSMELWTSVLEKQSRDWRRREILRRAFAGRDPFAISDGQQCFAVPWPRISQSRPHTAQSAFYKTGSPSSVRWPSRLESNSRSTWKLTMSRSRAIPMVCSRSF